MRTNMQELRIVDNFYQTSSYFPMPTLLIGTLAEDGSTTYGAYSLCFPFYVAGKEYYAMMLNCRNSSNTCKNILRTGKASLNFVPADKGILKECVRLGFPGDTAGEKMKDFCLTMRDGLRQAENPDENFPKVIEEAYQAFECTWMREIDGADRDTDEIGFRQFRITDFCVVFIHFPVRLKMRLFEIRRHVVVALVALYNFFTVL